MSGLTIRALRTDADAAHVTDLVWQFFEHLRDRYPERARDIDAYIAHQDIAGQLRDWRTAVTPPAGECLLALLDDRPVGMVLLRRISDTTCEMNRMFVTGAARGRKAGRRLAEALIEAARGMGFSVMRLDAWDRHDEALALYAARGFERYHEPGLKPDTMTHDIVHMRRTL